MASALAFLRDCLQYIVIFFMFTDMALAMMFALILDGFFDVNDPDTFYANNTLAENCTLDAPSFIIFLRAHNLVFGVAFVFFFIGAFAAVIFDFSQPGSYSRFNFVTTFYGGIPLFLMLLPILFIGDLYLVTCGCYFIGIIIIYRLVAWVCFVIQNFPEVPKCAGGNGVNANNKNGSGVNEKKVVTV